MKGFTKQVLVVGSINTDLVVKAAQLPLRGQTITGESFHTYQGGKGANQAVAAARLGAKVAIIGKVGSDEFGRASIQSLEASGVDCAHVAIEPGDSGLAIITVGASGENTIVVIPGANAAVTPDYIDSKRAVIQQAGIVLAQLEIPLESVLRLAEICREEGVPLMLDPAPAIALPDALYGLCDWLTPNETEAAFYAGTGAHEEPAAVAEALRKRGAINILLKLGERGAYIQKRGEAAQLVAPFLVNAVDTTAAGDTFNGAFATALTAGEDLAASGRFACAAAAISVTRMGAQASMPSAADLQDFLAKSTV
jgi:ribokinase